MSVKNNRPTSGPPSSTSAGAPLGNPYKPTADTDAIELFRQWRWRQLQDPTSPATVELHRLAALARAGDLQLGCWCAPEPCHAEVIKSAIEWLMSQANA